MIFDRILRVAPPGTIIPKPEAEGGFIIKGVGVRRGERAIIYRVPNHKRPEKPCEKGINASELQAAYNELLASGHLTRQWFREHLPKCDNEGSCNFTSVGGMFELLGEAVYYVRS